MSDPKQVASGTAAVSESFRRHFLELSADREKGPGRRALHSVDHVAPGDRFFGIVEVSVSVSNVEPGQTQTDLSGWREDESELEERPPIRSVAAELVRGFEIASRPEDAGAYAQLIAAAPEFLKQYTRRDGLSVERYFREAASGVGEVRADRPTISMVGSIFLRKNFSNWLDVLTYGARNQPSPASIFWLAPAVSGWSATAKLPNVLTELKEKLGVDRDEPPISLCLAQMRSDERQLEMAFDRVALLSGRPAPSLECVLVPKIACALIVHAPIKANHGFPVPLGILSFDEQVVARSHALLASTAAHLGDSAEDLLELLR